MKKDNSNDQSRGEKRISSDEALRESEKKYRTLFNSMDNGVVTPELIFENEKALDFRYLEHDRTVTIQTGLTSDIIGSGPHATRE